jgi:hypothetical protein
VCAKEIPVMQGVRNKIRSGIRAGRPLYSIFPGVTFDKSKERWRQPWKAVIGNGRGQVKVGRFRTELEAARAYINVRIALDHGAAHGN